MSDTQPYQFEPEEPLQYEDDSNCGICGYCSKHYIFKKYIMRVNCPFNFGLILLTWKCQLIYT